MEKDTDDGMKIVTKDYLVVSDEDTGEILEKRNGELEQERLKNEQR